MRSRVSTWKIPLVGDRITFLGHSAVRLELGGTTLLADPLLRRRGFRNVTELVPGDATRIGAVEVTATEADHDGRRWPIGPAVDALGFDLRAAGSRVYFAGDTDLFAG